MQKKRSNRKSKNRNTGFGPLGCIMLIPGLSVIALDFLFTMGAIYGFAYLIPRFHGIEDSIAALYNGEHVIIILFIFIAAGIPPLLVFLWLRFKDKKIRRKDAQFLNKMITIILLILVSLGFYAGNSYIIITSKQIYISGISTLFHQKKFNYDDVTVLLFKYYSTRGGRSLSAKLYIDNNEIEMLNIGYFKDGSSASMIRLLYKHLIDNSPNKVKIKSETFINDEEREHLKEILQN